MSDGNNISDSIAVWEALAPLIKTQIAEQTASCLRSKKMNVITAPSNGKIGVAEPFGDEIKIPYSSDLSTATAGSSVRVVWADNDFSTAVALWRGGMV